MKKTLCILLAAILCLSLLAGCGGDSALPKTELTTFSSAGGYTVSYPTDYTPTSLSHDIDFVVMDERTGTTVSIQTKEADDATLTEHEFVEQKRAEGMDIRLSSFEEQIINELPALVVTYTYNENSVTQIIYEGREHSYFATYTELPGISKKVRDEMTAIINSLTE